jgi:predicted nucleic acid-binding protein
MIYVDTSAFFALVNSDDQNHSVAEKTWTELLQNRETLICNNYILVESTALIQNRLGLEALKIWHEDIVPVLQVEWLDESLHNSIMQMVLSSDKRTISFIDRSSFDSMRRNNTSTAFTFDKHFRDQGFEIIP